MPRQVLCVLALAAGCSSSGGKGAPQPSPESSESSESSESPASSESSDESGASAAHRRGPNAGDPELHIEVKAQRWQWSFRYPDGLDTLELHLPSDTPVRLEIEALDGSHVFSAEALGVTRRIPAAGETVTVDLRTGAPGKGALRNADTSEPNNAKMTADIIIHEREEFDQWYESALEALKGPADEARGKLLFENFGCAACHSVDGTRKTGPSLKGVWKRITEGTVRFNDGRTLAELMGKEVASPEDYVKRQVLEPRAFEVEGFHPVAPSFEGKLSEGDLVSIIEYLKTL